MTQKTFKVINKVKWWFPLACEAFYIYAIFCKDKDEKAKRFGKFLSENAINYTFITLEPKD